MESLQAQDDANRTGHFYDGIEELDYSPPYWFVLLFYATVVWGVGYYFYYTFGTGKSLAQEYSESVGANRLIEITAKQAEDASGLDEAGYQALLKDEAVLKAGAAVFQSKCLSCHGAQGQGGIGPNMTDLFYIHGGKMTDLAKVVKEGVGDKGMPPWGPVLSRAELEAVVAFSRSLRGTHPPGAKAPQGVEYSGD